MTESVKNGEKTGKDPINGQFTKGNTYGEGRPKGSALKEYQANKYREMSDEEKDEELKKMSDEFRWRMGEGNPHQTEESTVEVILPEPLLGGKTHAKPSNNSNK